MSDTQSSQFVFLHHQLNGRDRESHYDLMFEVDGQLLTWTAKELPSESPDQIVERIHNHRLDYLNYEGPISGDRGLVKRIDRGHLAIKAQSNQQFVLTLKGEVYRGKLTLELFDEPESQRWRLRFEEDTRGTVDPS